MKFIDTINKLEYLWNLADKNTIIYDQLKRYDIDINNITYSKKNTNYLIASNYDFRINQYYRGLIKLEGFTERTLPFLNIFLKLLPETALVNVLGNYSVGLSILTFDLGQNASTRYFALVSVDSSSMDSVANIYLQIKNPQSYYEISRN